MNIANKFELTSIEEANIVLVFDYSNLANRVYHATSDHRYDKNNFLNKISEYLFKLEHFKKIALVWAIDCEPTRKKSYFPEYKGTRPERDVDPKAAMLPYIQYYTSTTIFCDGEEADDVIASFTERYKHKKIILVTNDKDMDQLIGIPNLVVVDPKTEARRTEELCIDQFGVTPKCVALFKAVFGDRGDNVVTAVPRMRKDPVLPIMEKAGGDLHEFLNILTTDKEIPEKISKPILDASDRVFLNWKLVDLKKDIDFTMESITPDGDKKVA